MTRLFIAFLPFCGDGHRISSRVPAPPVFIKAADQASDRSHRTANGALYGRPNGTPAATVCTGLRWTLPSRLLLRVSTNDTGPSTTSMMATSPGAPTCRLPSLGMRLITAAGLIVAIATTCSSEKPSPHSVVEAAAAVADVEDHAALLRGQRRRQQPAILHDIGKVAGEIGKTRIAMGENVTRPQQ